MEARAADEWGSGRIESAFSDLKEQNARIFSLLEQIRADSQLQFAALDNKYVSKDALVSEVRLMVERAENQKREADMMMIGFAGEMKAMREAVENTEQRRHTDRITFGLAAVAGAVAIFGSYVSVGYFH